MHQEKEYPERTSATELRNPDFAALARAFGGWATTLEATDAFVPALEEALSCGGIRLIHCKTDIEQITNATTIAALRAKAKGK
jgi:acetolactate synthase-1/2/3 large subunit